jgi:hypothetical protein
MNMNMRICGRFIIKNQLSKNITLIQVYFEALQMPQNR